MAKLKDGSRVYGNLTVDTDLLVSTDATILGNLNVSGSVTTVNSTTIQVEGPIVQQGAGANGAPLTSNDSKDRGLDLSYFAGGAQKEAFMGYKLGTNEFIFANVATIASDVVTVTTYGNVRAGSFIGEGDQLGNINGANVTGWVKNANYANYAGTVVNSTQSNITLLGTQTSLTVSGTSNLAGVNANGVVNVTNSTTSTSTSTGALQVAGGAGIVGDLWVGGTIHGAISGSTSAPGANTDIVFNDAGQSNATGGFTFDKTSNVVTIGGNITLDGQAGNANVTRVNATTGNITTVNATDVNTTNVVATLANVTTANVTTGNITTINSTTINAKDVTGTGNLSIANASVTGLTTGQIVYPGVGGTLQGDSSLTYASGLLSATNLHTGDANITGNVKLSGHTAGNLLTTDNNGKLVDSTLQFSSGGNLSVGNLSVSGDTSTQTLEVTSLNSGSVPIIGSGGAVTQSANLTFDKTSKTLSADNVTSSGTVQGGNLVSTSLTNQEVVFADNAGTLKGSSNLLFDGSTLTATGNVTATSTVQGANVVSTSLTGTEVVFADTGGRLKGSLGFTFASDTLTANTINAAVSFNSPNIHATTLNTNSVVFAGSGGLLSQDAGFDYFTGNATLTTGNIKVSTDATVTGNITAGNVSGGNLVSANYVTGTLTTHAQPNITSVGTLIDLTVTGNTTTGGVVTDHLYYANGNPWDFNYANGSTGAVQFKSASGDLQGDNSLNYDVANTTLTLSGTANITTVHSTTVTATTGNITTVNATTGNITTVNATDVNTTGNVSATGNVSGNNATVTHNLQAGNITSTGTLSAGDTTLGNTTVNGNLVVTGTTTSVNTTVTQLSDPLFDLGNGANGAALSSDDGMDRGLLMHVYSGSSAKNLFMGWKNTTNGAVTGGEFVLAKNVTVADNVVTVPGATTADQQANLADLRLGNIYAYNANFGGVVFSNGNVTLGAGSSFVGNLAGDVTGNISGTIKVTGGAGAIQFANATNVMMSSANLNFDTTNDILAVGYGVGGTVKSDYLTGTLTTAAQPNITSVGTLTSLSVTGTTTSGNFSTAGNVTATGNVSAGNVKTDNLLHANGTPWDFATAAGSAGSIQISDGTDLANVSGFTYSSGNLNVPGNLKISSGNISGATNITGTHLYGTIETAAQPNITSVGTLANLTVTDYITSSGTITGVTVLANDIGNSTSFLHGDGHDIANINGANVSEVALATNVTASAQPSITSVGALTSLEVLGDITADANVIVTGNVQASYFKGNGATLSSITGANVTGYVPLADTANVALAVNAANLTGTTLASTVVNSSLTSVGTLVSANVTGNVKAGNVFASQIGNASTYLYGDGSNITGVTAYSMNAANLTGSTLNSSVVHSSLTDLGTLTSLTVDGVTTLGPIGNVKISGGTSGQYLQTNGSGTLSWSTVDLSQIDNGTSNVKVALNSNVTVAVAGTQIINVASTGLEVTGVITGTGNIIGNNITSNHFLTVNGTTDSANAISGAITTAGGISAQGNIYTGNVLGFAHGSANTDSAAYIKYNATSGSLDFIFN